MKANERDEQLLAAAARIACDVGYMQITREAVAEAAGVSPAVISHRFGTMVNFKRDLMRYAIRKQVLPIVAQGLAVGDRFARRAPYHVQQNARDIL